MKKLALILLLIVVTCTIHAVSFLAKDGLGLKTYPGDMRSKAMGLTGVALTGDFSSSPANPATTALQQMIILSFGETASSISLSYERFSEFKMDEESLEAPYLNIVFPLPVKNTVISAYYYAPMNSYFQGTFYHEYEHPDGVSGDITDVINVNYFKNLNIIGFSASHALPYNLAFSLGFECLFGNNKTEYTIVNDAFTDTTTSAKLNEKILGYGLKAGVLYSYKDVSVGLSYRPTFTASVDRSYNITKMTDSDFNYPSEMLFGVTYNGKKYTLSMEYGSEKWSSTHLGSYGKTDDLSRVSFGGEYLLDIRTNFLSEKETTLIIPLRAGYYSQTGLYQNGKESAFSFGTSFKPFKTTNAAFDVMISFGSREMDLNDIASNGIVSRYSEDFVTFGISFTAKDLWFREKKK